MHWLSLMPALEGLIVPSKLYGILAAARPVVFIGDPDGEVARVVAPARAGFSVAPGQGVEVARLLAQLKSDPALCRTLGGNAHRLYRERYTGRLALERWAALLRPVSAESGTLRPDRLRAGAGIRPLSDR